MSDRRHDQPVPGRPRSRGSGPAGRLRAVEETVAALASEVRTRRLAVCDAAGREQIVAEVLDGQAQLRLSFVGARRPATTGDGPRGGASPVTAAVLVFACPAHDDLGPLAGVQVWAEGDVVAAIEAWQDGTGRWRSAVELADG